MITFSVGLALLILGYVFYGALVDRIFGSDPTRETPCYSKGDGIDFIPMPSWKVFLIQFLNIAGTGPIFGAIMGIQFGPAAYLWIVLGCIFIGAMHDYVSGMISLRKGGVSLPEIIGDELGNTTRVIVRILCAILLIMAGTVFIITPADLLSSMTSGWGTWGSVFFWSIVIFMYYILATLLPIDALIGRIYPLFGAALLFMAVGIGINIYVQPGWMPELTDGLTGHHPKDLAVFPLLFITIACGALSGFHATQSPMMARCMKNERQGRHVFYGAMIVEGIVALIWAAAAIKYSGSYKGLDELGTPAIVVSMISNTWLGKTGAVLTVLGVVAAPITTGDTAFRSARLMVADFMHFKQDKLWQRLALALPLFAVAVVIMQVDFSVLWRYFGWSNQTLGCLTLWAVTVYLARQAKFYWISLLPAMFMTLVCTSYIMYAPEGFQLPWMASVVVGVVLMLVSTAFFFRFIVRRNKDK